MVKKMSLEKTTELEKGLLEGVSQGTINKLRAAGLVTLLQIAVVPPKEIIERTDIKSLDTASKVVVLAQRAISRYRTAAQYYEDETADTRKLSTGIAEFDDILRGGFELGSITELWGRFQMGKTQMCYTVAILVQNAEEEGGLNAKALVIDTENTFKGIRVAEIAEARGLDVQQTLENIHIIRIYNSDHLEATIRALPETLQEDNYGLLIVDSMATHFRGEYVGRGVLAERQGKLAGILQNLMRVAESFNLVVLVTNQAQANVTGYGANEQPALGHIMAHACTHRIHFRKGRGLMRIAKIYDSPILPPNEARFLLTEKGAESVEETEVA